MTDRAALEALAARVEALQGPDREVDALIVTTLCPNATIGEYAGYEDIVFHAEAIGIPNKEICPFFTASIDAAMSLVPEGWHVGQYYQGPSGKPHSWELRTIGAHDQRYKSVQARSSAPALALTAACLRAIPHHPNRTSGRRFST